MIQFFDHIESTQSRFHLTELSLLHAVFPLKFAFKHAAHSRKVNETLLLVGKSPNGQYCIGECLPRPYVTGESVETVQTAVQAELAKYYNDYLHQPWTTLVSRRTQLLRQPGGIGALCLLELCLVDGILREAPISFLQSPNVLQNLPQITLTIPFLPPLAQHMAAIYLQYFGPVALKIKVTGKFLDDVNLLQHFMRGEHHDVRIDLNGALGADDASIYLENIAKKFPAIRWIEEPLNIHARHELPNLHQRFGTKFIFCGDESIVRIEDLEHYKNLKDTGAVNLRVGKHGGIMETVSIARRASELSLKLQVGSLVGETALLTGAGIIASTLIPQVDYLELGLSPKLLKRQPFQSWYRLNRSWRIESRNEQLTGLIPFIEPRKIFERTSLVKRFQLQ